MNALQIIQLRAPQWGADPRVNNLIIYAREVTGAEFFGTNTERAIALRVLHTFALENLRNGNPGAGGGTSSGTGHAGQIASETEGHLSRSFASANFSNTNMKFSQLATTVYGQELIELIRSSGMSAMTRQDDPNG